MTPKRGSLDPDTYQKRDIKRRVRASEKHLLRLMRRLDRIDLTLRAHSSKQDALAQSIFLIIGETQEE